MCEPAAWPISASLLFTASVSSYALALFTHAHARTRARAHAAQSDGGRCLNAVDKRKLMRKKVLILLLQEGEGKKRDYLNEPRLCGGGMSSVVTRQDKAARKERRMLKDFLFTKISPNYRGVRLFPGGGWRRGAASFQVKRIVCPLLSVFCSAHSEKTEAVI